MRTVCAIAGRAFSVAASAFCAACSVNDTGIVQASRVQSDEAIVEILHAPGIHLNTSAAHASITLGHATFVNAKVLSCGTAFDRMIYARVTGVHLALNTADTGVMIGFRETLSAFPGVPHISSSLQFDPDHPDPHAGFALPTTKLQSTERRHVMCRFALKAALLLGLLPGCSPNSLYVAHETVLGVNAKVNQGRAQGQLLVGYDRDFATVIPTNVKVPGTSKTDAMSLVHCSLVKVESIYLDEYSDFTATGDAAANIAADPSKMAAATSCRPLAKQEKLE